MYLEGTKRKGQKSLNLSLHRTFTRTVTSPDLTREKALKEEHVGMIIGALAAMILLLFAVAVFIVLRNQRKKHEEEAYDVYEKHRMTHDTDEMKVMMIK